MLATIRLASLLLLISSLGARGIAVVHADDPVGPAASDPSAHHDDSHTGGHDDGHDDGHQEESVALLISHADTMYWFAMQERGSLVVIDQGLKYADEARELLEEVRKEVDRGDHATAYRLLTGHPPDPDQPQDLGELMERYGKQINALQESDLHYRLEQTSNTHYGVFPLARFVRSTLFSEPRAAGSFEVVDDPEEVAAREAVEAFIHQIEAQTRIPQFDVVFVSGEWINGVFHSLQGEESGRELENEALYLFNQSSRFFVHNLREIENGFSSDEQAELYDEDFELSSTTLAKLRGLCKTPHMLLFRISKLDRVHDEKFFFIAEGRVFEVGTGAVAGQAAPVESASDTGESTLRLAMVLKNYGFCIDRSQLLPYLLAMHAFLLVFSLFLYRYLARYTSHMHSLPSWSNTLVFGGLGFLAGRCLIWVVAPMLSAVEPEPETLAWLTFWWPATAGLVIVIGPAIVLRVAERRFGWLGDHGVTFGRGGAAFACAALGAGTFLAQSVLIYLGFAGWPAVAPILLAATLAGFIVGRAQDEADPVPLRWGIGALVAVFALGLVWCHAEWAYMWGVAVVLMGMTVCLPRSAPRRADSPLAAPERSSAASRPADAENPSTADLVAAALDPPFQPNRAWSALSEALRPWQDGHAVRVSIEGPAGAGKSALLRALQPQGLALDPNAHILAGACAEPQAGSIPQPYQPFSDAIAEHFAVNLLAPAAHQMKQMDEALGGIFDSVVPFADILFPPAQHGKSGSKRELYLGIAAMLRRLTAERPVLLLLDDTQWMDDASRELLEFLLDEFPVGGNSPLAIVLAGRGEPPVSGGRSSWSVVPVPPADRDATHDIMVNSLRLDPQVADDLLDAVGDRSQNLHWLLQVVVHMARQESFIWSDTGYQWCDSSTNVLDKMPRDFHQSLEALVNENQDFRNLLEVSALVGPEFPVHRISHGLGLSRLDVIRQLDRLESESGLVHDVTAKDEMYAFRSPFVLELLRRILGIDASGPHQPARKRMREYHYRLAAALEKTLEHSNAAIYAVANHYYASGARHADKALEYSLRAAETASTQFQHDLARRYLEMAEHCVPYAHEEHDSERESLLIACREAHVEGQHRVEMADRALRYLESHSDAPLEVFLATAQALYDAGLDTREPRYFADCVRVARESLERFHAPQEQAAALHFCGIGLPLSRGAQRRKNLEAALELLETTDERDIEALRLKSHVINSLAEEMSRGTEQDRNRARALFERGIQLKSREDIRDTEGLAMSHGGLGRLEFFADPPNIGEARRHFEKDLVLSCRIGSRSGQSKMHSLLGSCDLQQSHLESACQHFASAYQFADERVDKFFALCGLVECHALLENDAELNECGEDLAALARPEQDVDGQAQVADPIQALPAMCRDRVVTALQRASLHSEQDWHRRLSKILAASSEEPVE